MSYVHSSHSTPGPDLKYRRWPASRLEPQNATQAIYIHISFTQHTIEPMRPHTANIRHIDLFRLVLYNVSNI